MSNHSAYEPSCVYCGRPGPFSKEHVISAGLGGDDNRYLLREMVCKVCNTDIFSPLELELLRSSPIAIARSFHQPFSRKRGKNTGIPRLDARVKQMMSEDGFPDEIDFGQHGKPETLPQLKIVGESRYHSTAECAAHLKDFVASLSDLVDADVIHCIQKLSSEHELRYEVTIAHREGNSFTLSKETRCHATPPASALWVERYPDAAKHGSNPMANIYRTRRGSIVLKTGTLTIEQALEFYRLAVKQIAYDRLETRDVVNPIVSVQMTVTVGVMERMIAKNGINLVAYYLGRDYVNEDGFRSTKDAIVTGSPHLNAIHVEAPEMLAIFDFVPENHHGIMLGSIAVPGGGYTIFMMAKLYGVCLSLSLASDLPLPPKPLPVFFTVDYVNHKVKCSSLAEFSARMIEALNVADS